VNFSELTRKQQVLEVLKEQRGLWVNGSELATEKVGGSEGIRRLRELRAEGWPIEERKHPDPARDIWQYRLSGPRGAEPYVVSKETKAPPPPVTETATCWNCRTILPPAHSGGLVVQGDIQFSRCPGCHRSTLFVDQQVVQPPRPVRESPRYRRGK
jgi:hypothetical protein